MLGLKPPSVAGNGGGHDGAPADLAQAGGDSRRALSQTALVVASAKARDPQILSENGGTSLDHALDVAKSALGGISLRAARPTTTPTFLRFPKGTITTRPTLAFVVREAEIEGLVEGQIERDARDFHLWITL
jgi:hypothetical protein